MNFGLWEGKRLSELRAEPGGEAEQREGMGLDFRAPEGESPREVQERLQGLLQDIARFGRPCVALTHKAVIRALYALATGWTMKEKPEHKLKDQAAQIFEIDAAGRPSIKELNRLLTRAP
jgi:probable phosphoglycerate mutase